MNDQLFSNLEINNLLKDIDFEPVEIIKNIKDEIILLQGLWHEQEVFLKIIDQIKYPDIIANIEKERSFTSLISSPKFKSSKKNLFISYIKAGKFGKFYWAIREFRAGTSLSYIDIKRSLVGYDILRKKYIDKNKMILNSIFEGLDFLQSLPAQSIKQGSRYKRDVSEYDIPGIEGYLGIKLTKILEFFNKYKNTYWSIDRMAICHGDLSPSNIIVSEKEVYLIDYELSSVDNRMMDIAYLWLFLWRYPNWQHDIIEAYVEDQEMQVEFTISVQRILLFIYWLPGNFLKGQSRAKEDIISYNRNHVWTKYLNNAYDFTGLTNERQYEN